MSHSLQWVQQKKNQHNFRRYLTQNLWLIYQPCFTEWPPGVLVCYMCCQLLFESIWHVCTHQTWLISNPIVRIDINLLCGAFFSKGLWGLVAMLASSASQLVLGEQLNSWWDTPAPTWNNPGDLWSSSTSCRSGMSSGERSMATLMIKTWESSVFLNVECSFLLV